MIYSTISILVCTAVTQILWRRDRRNRFLKVCNIITTTICILWLAYLVGYLIGTWIK